MRAAVILAAVAPAAIASAIPAFEGAHSFDKREDLSATTLGGKILSADLYAGVAGLNQQIYQATQKGDQWKKCNPLNIVVRREWCVSPVHETCISNAYSVRATFSSSEKRNYISAVQCMAKLPPKTPKAECPGCKNRYDDFVATHIKQTFSVC